MLTEEQIDYLLQIRDTKPPLPEKTVRVMLSALRWSDETIDHAILFLARPAGTGEEKAPAPIDVSEPPPPPSPAPKPVNIKQNPFPIGSPLIRNARLHEQRRRRLKHPFIDGAIFGLVIFIIGLVLFAQFSPAQ